MLNAKTDERRQGMKSKHYRALAHAMAATAPPADGCVNWLVRYDQWQKDCDAVAATLAAYDRPDCRFDRGKWLEALAQAKEKS